MTQNNEGSDQIPVMFTYVNTGMQTKFSTNKDTKFDDVLNEAFNRLKEQRKPSDKFFCADGTSLKDYLDKDIHYVIENICKSGDFEIRGPSGGAYFF